MLLIYIRNVKAECLLNELGVNKFGGSLRLAGIPRGNREKGWLERKEGLFPRKAP